MVAGAILYALSFDWLKSHVLNVWKFGKIRLPDITGVPDAAKMLVVARTKKLDECKSRSDGLSMFLIDVDRQGP